MSIFEYYNLSHGYTDNVGKKENSITKVTKVLQSITNLNYKDSIFWGKDKQFKKLECVSKSNFQDGF